MLRLTSEEPSRAWRSRWLACRVLSQAPSSVDSPESPSATVDIEPALPAGVTSIPAGPGIGPDELEYLGAFRLPGGGERPDTFAYGGGAMT